MKKCILLITLSFISQLAYCGEAKSEGLSKAQWWVLGTTGVVLAATGLSSHPHSVSDDRKTIALVGAVAFVGVTLYENTHKKEKLALTIVDDGPAFTFRKAF